MVGDRLSFPDQAPRSVEVSCRFHPRGLPTVGQMQMETTSLFSGETSGNESDAEYLPKSE